MNSTQRFVDGAFCDSAGPIREAAQPQGAGEAESVHVMIKPEGIRDHRARLGCASDATLTIKLRRGLVAHKMATNAEHKIRDCLAGRILRGLCESCALLCD